MIPLIYNERAELDENGKQITKDQFIKDTFSKLKDF